MFLLIIIATLLISAFLIQRNRNKKNLPPGPIRWPIIGSIPQLMMCDASYPHLQLTGLAKKYGKIVSFGFGVHYSVVVSNFHIMMDLFRREETYLERFRFDFLEQRNNYKNLGIIWGYGDTWKEQRKVTVNLLRKFGFGKNTMDETIQDEVNDLVADIQNDITASRGVWEVNTTRLSACQVNILWASVGGYRFDPHSAELKRQLEIYLEIFDSLGPSNLLGAFPFLKFFPKLSGFEKQRELHQASRDFLMELIDESKKRRQSRSEPESFIDAYLDKVESNKSNVNSMYSEDQLLMIVMDLFLAGSETASSLLTWLILYVGVHENVQKKARAEIRNYCMHTPHISARSIESMPYIRAIILESMRLAPFLMSGAARRVTKDIECGGYTIPEGTCLLQNLYAVFHDELFWGDTEVFRPERFLLPDGTLDSTKTERIVQFGIGPRICPGEAMATNSIFLTIVTLLQKFTLGIVPAREPSLDPGCPCITLKPKPYALQLTKIN